MFSLQQQINGTAPGKPGVRTQSHTVQEEEDSSDDNSSYHDDDLDSSDEEEEEGSVTVGKVKDLEWDNSTLAI